MFDHEKYKQKILKQAQIDPVLAACLVPWKEGRLSWQHCMMMAVINLSAQKEGLLKTIVQMKAERAPGPPIIRG